MEEVVKTRTSIIALLAAVAAVAAGCGGASDEKGTEANAAGGGDGSKGTLSLVAYSTPQVVYDEIIPDFTATPDMSRLRAFLETKTVWHPMGV